MNIGKLTKFAALAQYTQLTPAQLTPEIVAKIADAVGVTVKVDSPTFESAIALLREDNVEKLADVMSKPELIGKLKFLFENAAGNDDNLLVCPHCGEFMNPQPAEE